MRLTCRTGLGSGLGQGKAGKISAPWRMGGCQERRAHRALLYRLSGGQGRGAGGHRHPRDFRLDRLGADVADQLAAAGYIAIAPDLLSGTGPNGGGTSEFAERDEVTSAAASFQPDQIMGDLNAAADYVKSLPSCNGKLAVAGFCSGGGQTFRFACNRGRLESRLCFLRTASRAAAEMENIKCPVHRLLRRKRHPDQLHHAEDGEAHEGRR